MFRIGFGDVPNHDLAYEKLSESIAKGIRVDVEKVKELIKDYNKKAYDVSVELISHGINNPNSPAQVKAAFMKALAPEDVKLCEWQGKITFKKEILNRLSEAGYGLADILKEYRNNKKYAENLQSLLEHTDSDGLIHPELTRGITNRFNYSKPALMNIPKKLLWDVIIPRGDGNVLYSIDIHQQEPYIIINMLEIEELLDLVREEGDFYKALYRAAFSHDCTEEQRTEVKRAWNAMSYGATQASVCEYCTLFDGKVLYKYFNSIPEYKEYKNKCFSLSKKHTHATKTLFGTEIFADEEGFKLARMLMNIPVQGTGADILAFLIENFYDKTLTATGQESSALSLYYTRHDEIIVEVDGKYSEESVLKFLNEVFEHCIEDWEPFKLQIQRVSADVELEDEDE
jgi:DNA polymerase I-like protein with 3'-5' exonuclease and polymerase domains